MKKLLTLLVFLATTVGAMAQLTGTWSNTKTGQANTTVVYASLSISNTTDVVYGGLFTIAAFVGEAGQEDCRLVFLDNDGTIMKTFHPEGAMVDVQYLALQIPGNYGSTDDDGKPITFMIKKVGSDEIYKLTSSTAITYRAGDGNAYGAPSAPVELSVTLPTSYSLPTSFDVGVGKTVNVRDKITVSPEGAAVPLNAWAIEGPTNGEATLSGDILTGVSVYSNATLKLLKQDGTELTSCKFNVVQYATAVNIATTSFQVNKGDKDNLTKFMQNKLSTKSYSLDPANSVNGVEWEIESSEYITTMDGWEPIKVGTTRIRPYIYVDGVETYPAGDAWITVEIVTPVTSASLNWDSPSAVVNFKCNVGDDIYNRIASRVTILPSDAGQEYTITVPDAANSQYFTISDKSIVVNSAPATATSINLRVTPTGLNGSNFAFDVPVSIDNWATTLAKVKDGVAFTSTMSASTVQQGIINNVTYGPTGTGPNITFTAPGPWLDLHYYAGVGGRGDISTEDGDLALSLDPGEHTVTATLTYPDYSNYYGDESTITNATKTVTFTVTISAGLLGFDITVTPDATDPTKGTITLQPNPSSAVYDISDYTMSLQDDNSYTGWTVMTFSPALTTAGLTYDYTGALPGKYTFNVSKGDARFGTKQFTVPAVVSLASGWQWKSNPFGAISTADAMKTFFTTNLVEARTYTQLLFNDPSWGIVGSMLDNTLAEGQMYKAKMSAAATSYLEGADGETPITKTLQWQLHPGWNWVGSPFLYNHRFSTALSSTGVVNGMIIVSKADGSIEYNGTAWEGSLSLLKAGEGYLVYNPGTSAVTLTSTGNEGALGQGNESASARNRAPMTGVWEYDHSRFASNMTIVAEMPQLEDADHYTIGAFVDGECRGEGSFINGHAFITVHGESGEQVNFRLYNEMTGEYFDIDQTVKSQTRVGSLSNPMTMTSHEFATGISVVRQENAGATESYDLSGRKVDGSSKGVSLKRMADGTFRKVMK